VISRANSAALSALVVEQTCGGARRLRDRLLERPIKYPRPRCVLRQSEGMLCGKGALVDCRSGVLDVLVWGVAIAASVAFRSAAAHETEPPSWGPPLQLRLRTIIEQPPANGEQYTKRCLFPRSSIKLDVYSFHAQVLGLGELDHCPPSFCSAVGRRKMTSALQALSNCPRCLVA
jgi:hypothetical protein